MTTERRIRAIIFDLGNVLLPFDHRRGCRAAARRSALSAEEVYRRLWGTQLVERFETGRIGTREFFRRARDLIEYRGTLAELQAAWNDIFRSDPAMDRLLRELAGKRSAVSVQRSARNPRPETRNPSPGLVLLSNTNRSHFAFVRRQFPIVRHFRRRVLSCETHRLKPDAAVFRLAVAKAGVPAESCLYIDDLPEYISAAASLGLRALLFRGARRLRADLRRLGLPV